MNNAPTPEKSKKPIVRPIYELIDWVEVFLTALVTVILLFTFFFRIVVVSGSSMATTLQEGDYLILTNLGYTPRNGDVVVLQTTSYANGKKPLIKRVIATEGQWLDIDFETWEVRVGDTLETMQPINEDYVYKLEGIDMELAGARPEDFPMQIREGHVFVMGDNRNNSTDSRAQGSYDIVNDECIYTGFTEDDIIGKVLFRIMPLHKFGAIKPAEPEPIITQE